VSVLTHPLLDSRVCLRTLTIGIVSGSAPKEYRALFSRPNEVA
jgi:hypothetical protein